MIRDEDGAPAAYAFAVSSLPLSAFQRPHVAAKWVLQHFIEALEDEVALVPRERCQAVLRRFWITGRSRSWCNWESTTYSPRRSSSSPVCTASASLGVRMSSGFAERLGFDQHRSAAPPDLDEIAFAQANVVAEAFGDDHLAALPQARGRIGFARGISRCHAGSIADRASRGQLAKSVGSVDD